MSIQENEQQSFHNPPATPGRIRSHSLKPQHSRLDYARRKSAADMSLSIESYLESPTNNEKIEQSSSKPLSSWFKRRFTLFAIEQPINQKRRMTTDRFSFFDDKSCTDLLRQKRPSIIGHMFESFVRRISSRKKKRNTEREREEDQTIIDPVYETLKIAAETRKRTVAHYLQQRQQSLNKQTSLNSQGSSEPDVQASPGVTRHNNTPSTPQPQASSLSSGKKNTLLRLSSVVESYQLSRPNE